MIFLGRDHRGRLRERIKRRRRRPTDECVMIDTRFPQIFTMTIRSQSENQRILVEKIFDQIDVKCSTFEGEFADAIPREHVDFPRVLINGQTDGVHAQFQLHGRIEKTLLGIGNLSARLIVVRSSSYFDKHFVQLDAVHFQGTGETQIIRFGFRLRLSAEGEERSLSTTTTKDKSTDR